MSACSRGQDQHTYAAVQRLFASRDPAVILGAVRGTPGACRAYLPAALYQRRALYKANRQGPHLQSRDDCNW